MRYILNALCYQAIWLSAVLWGNVGAAAGCVIILFLFTISERRRDDFRMVWSLILLGLLVDGSLHQLDFFTFTTTGWPIPFWLLVIWAGLAMTIHHSLAWLKERLFLAAIFGGIGGPAAYWAGTRLGAAAFNWSLSTSLLLMAVIWSLILPVIMLVSRKQHQPHCQQRSADIS